MRSVTKVLLACCVAAMAALSLAQGGGGGGRGFGQGRGMGFGMAAYNGYYLLNREEVATEIKLTADQKTKIDAIQKDRGAAFQEARQNGTFGDPGGGPPDMAAMQKAMAKISKPFDDKIGEVLNADQKTRLNELAVQQAGPGALDFPEIAALLKLTDDQKAKIKDLSAKQMEANMALRQNQDMDREARQAAMAKNRETFKTEVDKILTDSQKATLKEKSGKAFTFKPMQGRGGGGGGGR